MNIYLRMHAAVLSHWSCPFDGCPLRYHHRRQQCRHCYWFNHSLSARPHRWKLNVDRWVLQTICTRGRLALIDMTTTMTALSLRNVSGDRPITDVLPSTWVCLCIICNGGSKCDIAPCAQSRSGFYTMHGSVNGPTGQGPKTQIAHKKTHNNYKETRIMAGGLHEWLFQGSIVFHLRIKV